MHNQVAFINENSINVKTEGGGRYGMAVQECAVDTLMSVRMATDVIKPLDFIASGIFSKKGPAFREFLPLTPPLLSVKYV